VQRACETHRFRGQWRHADAGNCLLRTCRCMSRGISRRSRSSNVGSSHPCMREEQRRRTRFLITIRTSSCLARAFVRSPIDSRPPHSCHRYPCDRSNASSSAATHVGKGVLEAVSTKPALAQLDTAAPENRIAVCSRATCGDGAWTVPCQVLTAPGLCRHQVGQLLGGRDADRPRNSHRAYR
jgi:hypothetical protein